LLVIAVTSQASGRLRVALDSLPLIGHPTGIGAFCLGALTALGERDDLDVRAYGVTWRSRAAIASCLPPGVSLTQRAAPERVLLPLWERNRFPPIDWFIGRVDVVHGTNFFVPPTKRAGAVVSVHDLTQVHHPELANQASPPYPTLIRRALQKGAWVHTDSAFIAGEVTEVFGADPDHVRVVAPGVPTLPEVEPEAARQMVQKYLPDGVSRYVLAVGTAEPRKDLPALVRAFDELVGTAPNHDLDDLALVLAGPPGWGEAALSDAVNGARFGQRVVRTGWVEPSVLSALLSNAAVLAYPSLYEGFGFPPLQAMAAGVPVVATTAGSLPEVLGQAAMLVDVGDSDALMQALSRVLGDERLRAHLVEAGTARATSFTWRACGDGLAHLYGDVAAAHDG